MIKPTMSHAVNKEQLNELLVKYYEAENEQLKSAIKSGDVLIETSMSEYKLMAEANTKLANKVETLSEKVANTTKATHGHIDTIARLQAECGKLESKSFVDDETIKQLTESLEAANRKNQKYNEALVYIANGSYSGASHISMDALGLI